MLQAVHQVQPGLEGLVDPGGGQRAGQVLVGVGGGRGPVGEGAGRAAAVQAGEVGVTCEEEDLLVNGFLTKN